MDNEQVRVHVLPMGISQLLVFDNKEVADEFRRLMREKEGRVGPLFEPKGWEGYIGFFTYSRRLLATMLEENSRYHVVGRPLRSLAAHGKSD